MAKWQPAKRPWQRYLYNPGTVALLALLVLGLSHRAWRAYGTYRLAERERDQAARELTALESRRAELAAEVALLQSQSGLEQKIRQKFSVVKEGEKVIAIIAPEGEEVPEPESQKPWWQFWGE